MDKEGGSATARFLFSAVCEIRRITGDEIKIEMTHPLTTQRDGDLTHGSCDGKIPKQVWLIPIAEAEHECILRV